jgi:hypothetical protein
MVYGRTRSDTTPAAACRTRIREHYTELHGAAAALQAQLDGGWWFRRG